MKKNEKKNTKKTNKKIKVEKIKKDSNIKDIPLEFFEKREEEKQNKLKELTISKNIKTISITNYKDNIKYNLSTKENDKSKLKELELKNNNDKLKIYINK